MAFKVFVSYSSHDLEHVEQLQQQLSDSPVEVFVAENSVAPSQELGSTISQAIEQCDLFILVWSKNAQESAWVSQEVGRAGALKKKILPLVLTEGMQLPGFIQSLKYLSVHKEPEKALAQARQIVVGAYEEKVKFETAHAQAEKDKLAFLAIGALLFWAFSK